MHVRRFVKVYLVGAGPGDPYLLTLKAKEILAKSNVVLYDNLVSSCIQPFISKKARTIFVGKRAGKISFNQQDINQILLEEYRILKKEPTLKTGFIVRLKGGDPFVFGRAVEEISVLTANHIPFEVIPGISSFHAGLVFAGIPFTDREQSSSFAVLTGHYKKNREFQKVQTSNADTTIYMMGMKHLSFIVTANLKSGKNADTPAAIIENASRPEQKVITGTLATIEKLAQQNNCLPPAIVIVGKVVSLRSLCDWWSNRRLWGRKILLTHKNDFLRKAFEMEGSQVIEKRAFTVESVDYPTSNLKKLLSEKNIVFFSCPRDVKETIRFLNKKKMDIRIFKHSIISGYDKKTEKELNKYHLQTDMSYQELLEYSPGNIPILFITEENPIGLSPFFKQKECHPITLYRPKSNDLSYDLAKVDTIILFSPLVISHIAPFIHQNTNKEILCCGEHTKKELISYNLSPTFTSLSTSPKIFFGDYMRFISEK